VWHLSLAERLEVFPMKCKKTSWLGLITGLLFVAGFSAFLTLNEYLHDGELQMDGLLAPVRVIRDEKGIPYIYAQNHHDCCCPTWINRRISGQ
jgi:acyl-homoserine lactone acylase PvdQ